VKHMIDSAENPGFFDGGDIKRFLDNAQHIMISFTVGAVLARVNMCQAVAYRAVENVLLGFPDRISQPIGLILRNTDDIKGNPLGRFRANTRNFFKFFDEAG
jgi:hypothetical protein